MAGVVVGRYRLEKFPARATFMFSHGPLLGIALKLAATLAFSVMALLIKLLGERYSAGQLVFFRSAFAMLPIFGFLYWSGLTWRSLATQRLGAHALRSGAGTSAMVFGFAGLVLLPLADATAIGFAAPMITVVLAVLLLGERVQIYRWAAVTAGFGGVVLMLIPHLGQGSQSLLGAVFCLLGAVSAAFAMIFLRRMSAPGNGQEPSVVIAFYFQLTAATLGLVSLPFVWVTPGWSDLGVLVMVGLFGGLGQLLMTQAHVYAPASTIATFDYAAMLWALIFGWLFLSEWPQAIVFIGAAIVIAAGLFIVWREHRLGIEAQRPTLT
ncbi:MAG TPA: EamA family transporter [Alphaproteobacteria bacterium]|nr:EamA family transporter [Alphaproteobacteria bacterium]